ncbi:MULTISPECIES: amidohydrolase family protein [Paraburkholderia]|uniref:amidohydrolase family protein n=1 Tax=Paraburkholderia TaxID=1822464 RepID=UPI0003773950|nr:MULTISPECIES: amidohydrolase family protein [Paraburkholderia]MDH6151174.1 MFS family permease [Paraburkholderia sp. WSM4179]
MAYVIITYLPIYAVQNLHMPVTPPFSVLLASVLLRAVTIPLFGHLADPIGGQRMIRVALALFLVVLYPAYYWIVNAPSFASIMSVELGFALLISASNAPIPTALAGLFPTEVRSTGLAISYNIGAAVFGGFSPMVLTWLLHVTGNNMMPAHFCAVFFALGLIGAFMLKRGAAPVNEFATCENGASGVMVLANIAGRNLTDPMFAPIWAEIDRRALPVLVHPTDPPGVDLMDMTKFDLSWAVGFMFDTTLAITRTIFEGFFDQYPNLKLIASHAGGALPYLAGRFEKGNEVEIPQRRKMKRKPIDYLRRIYYDCITYSPASLEFLVSVVGADRVMFGTDWPHQVYDIRGAFANTARLPKEQCDAIRGNNALRVFGF